MDNNIYIPKTVEKRPPTKTEINTYKVFIEPRIIQMAVMIANGDSEEEVCNFLGIDIDTFYAYKNYFPEFRNAIVQGKKSLVAEAEETLRLLAKGSKFSETEITEFYDYNQDGSESKKGKTVKTKTKVQPPSFRAVEMILTNLSPDVWKKNIPANMTQNNQNIINVKASDEDVQKILYRLNNNEYFDDTSMISDSNNEPEVIDAKTV